MSISHPPPALNRQYLTCKNTAEWVGTKLIFEIIEHGHETEVVFTHQGLRPTSECFEFCAPAWTKYMQTRLSTLLK
jgi:hypothetical protein